MSWGDSIKIARKKKKFTQQQLADMIGVSRVAITQFENEINNPGYDTIIKMSEILGIPEQDFFPGSEKSRKQIAIEEFNKDKSFFLKMLAPELEQMADLVADNGLKYPADPDDAE